MQGLKTKAMNTIQTHDELAKKPLVELNTCCTVQQAAEQFGLNEWTLRMWLNRLEVLRYTICPDTGAMMLPTETVHLVAEVVALTKRGGMTLDTVREYLATLVRS